MALNWVHPFTCLVSGPTGSGKTEFVFRLLKHRNEVIIQPPEKVLWCYGAYQESFLKIKDVDFHEGLPSMEQFDGKQRTLLILDDLMSETDDRVTKIFTKISHHANVSVIYITQNLFFAGKQNRTITLNAHYMALFKNVRDQTQITSLARQMFPGKTGFMQEAFKDATWKPYSYLFIDLKPNTDDSQRLRSQIFPDETNYVYVAK
jgi:hypothetical protein